LSLTYLKPLDQYHEINYKNLLKNISDISKNYFFPLHPHQHLLLIMFLMVGSLTKMRCNLNVVCGFDLHFLYGQGWWTFFMCFFSHLDFFLWNFKFCSIQLPISLLGHWEFGFWIPCIFWLSVLCLMYS
jgi:hypothetical protein